jgi:hypothetical protein
MTSDLSSDDQRKKQDSDAAGLVVGKERVEVRGRQEVTPMTEYTRKVDLEPEVEGWLEKIEKEEAAVPPVVDDTSGQMVLDDSQSQRDFKVVLPLTKSEVEKGLHHKILDSVRWLAEWCIKMIKMFGSKVAYKRQ